MVVAISADELQDSELAGERYVCDFDGGVLQEWFWRVERRVAGDEEDFAVVAFLSRSEREWDVDVAAAVDAVWFGD